MALVIGMLVGLQREYAFEGPEAELFAGVRTFALMGLFGCAAAFTADLLESPWPLAAAILVLGALLTITYYIDASQGKVGLTTEIAAILTVLAGALAYMNHLTLAVAIGVATTALLSIKLETQRFVRRLTRQDILATLKFAVVTAIVLPVLPNDSFGPPPLDVFNPYKVWLLVVLISGISFVGYILNKFVGARKGIGLTGLLGGLASSTAVTLTFTQRSKKAQGLARPFALAIIVAWTVMFSRVIVEVAVLNFALVRLLWLPVLASVTAGLAYAIFLFSRQRRDQKEDEVAISNPFELWPAIKFGLLFSVILVVARAAQVYLGTTGIYLSSLISGLADVDAIALSVAELSLEDGGLERTVAARAIILAAVANTLAKGGVVLAGGSPALRRAILPGYLLMMATGTLFAVLI